MHTQDTPVSVQQSMVETISKLKKSLKFADARAVGDVLFAEAMEDLLIVHIGLAREQASVNEEDLNIFRTEVSSLVRANNQGWFSYVYDSLNRAINSELNGWKDPCMRRSVIQFLSDCYPDVVDGEDREYVDEMDDWLRERAPRIRPAPPRTIPHGIPESHWWWRLPSGGPEIPSDDSWES
ncbi:hypothetical protein [Nocardia sp. NPDC052566]|uniref:hypothetical protein n=1 Tax=Nocardia sp. NPDC052566 TaxID=3364330 RepID=UPI0037C790B4